MGVFLIVPMTNLYFSNYIFLIFFYVDSILSMRFCCHSSDNFLTITQSMFGWFLLHNCIVVMAKHYIILLSFFRKYTKKFVHLWMKIEKMLKLQGHTTTGRVLFYK